MQLREVKWWQGNKGAERTPVPAAPFERVVREIDQKLHSTTHRFQRGAIKALQTATTEMLTDLLKLGNAITVHKGRVTLTGRTVRFAAEIMKLPTGPKRRRGGSDKPQNTPGSTEEPAVGNAPSAATANGQ